jgi:hypothetical protein
MPKLWNVLLTVLLLAVAYVITIALTYDGFCYGFSDGKSPCSFAKYFAACHAWFWIVFVLYFPHVLIVGAVIFYVNDFAYRVYVRTRTRRWLEKAGEEPFA